MGAKETIVVFVHGANQGRKAKTKTQNHQLWEEALNIEADNAARIVSLLQGKRNYEINKYHNKRHRGSDFPAYIGWESAWYGDIYNSLNADQSDPFEPVRLNFSDNQVQRERNLIFDLIEQIQCSVMAKHFDELVPFYELAITKKYKKTLYESICHKFLADLKEATENGRYDYVLIAHSMGCAVTYNVMSHISCAQSESRQPYCLIQGTLSYEYRQEIERFCQQRFSVFWFNDLGKLYRL